MPSQPLHLAQNVFTDQPVWMECLNGVEGGIDISQLPKGSVTSKTGKVSFSAETNRTSRVFVPLKEITIQVREPVHTLFGNKYHRTNPTGIAIVIVNSPPFPKVERETAVFDSEDVVWTYNCITEQLAHGYLEKIREVGFRVPDVFYRDRKAMAKLLSWLDAGKTIYTLEKHRTLPAFTTFPLASLTGVFQSYLWDRGEFYYNLTTVSISDCLQDSAFWVKACQNKDALALLSLLSIEGGSRNIQELIVETLVAHKLLSK